jgi:uncharacterized repeat protein (TIGR01451 family)
MLVVTSLVCGCAPFRVPKIDPTGQYILAPSETTTVVSPLPGSVAVAPSQGGFFPQPAWTTPAPLPPCGPEVAPVCPPVAIAPPVAVAPPVTVCPPAAPAVVCPPPAAVCPPLPAAIPVAPVVAVGQDSLVISPVRIIAPVGTQVVLLAGLRNPAGQYAPGEPIEWILSPESAGHFVEVGQESDYLLCHWLPHAPRKLDNNYAVGRTARHDQVITRGNADPHDDVAVLRGQSWLAVSSPTEGASLVTAVAPAAAGWDRRQQTAEIYWINAQWQLPAPAAARAGQPHALTTVVTRAGGQSPAAGWIVRYDIVGGAPASFSTQGDQGIDVVTDATGAATSELFPQPGAAGVTNVRIQIIRPGMAPHEPSRLTVGEGATTVAWSAPGLTTSISGPASAGVGTTLSFRIDVANPGDIAASDVVLTYTAPPGLAILGANPDGAIFGSRIEWRLGQLASGAAQSLVVTCRADQPGQFNNCVSAQSADGLTAEHCVLTRVEQSSISVTMTGPEEATVGEQVQFAVTVRNSGGTELTGVVVTDHFEAGLEHAVSASPIEKPLPNLAPGQEQQFAVTFRVARAGRLCHTLTAATISGQTATAQACITAREAPPQQLRPAMTLRAFGPQQQLQVGQTGEFMIEVANSGQVPLTAIRLAVGAGPSLKPVAATETDNRQQVGSQVVWTIERLDPGAVRRLQVNCQALAADGQAFVRAEATAREQVQQSAEATVAIVAAAQPGPAQKPMPQDEGALQVTLGDQDDPVRPGQSIRYRLILANTRSVSEQNVAITVTLPEKSTLVRSSGPTRTARSSPDGRTLELAPILEIRAGETQGMEYVFEVRPAQPGQAVFRASVASARHTTPIVVQEETTVLGP